MLNDACPTPIRVMMLGLRGFPDVQGGIERICERHCAVLADLGCEVEVVMRKRYVPADVAARNAGIKVRRLWSPKSRSLEAFVHTFLGVLYAAWRRPDILHIHAVGPAIWTPLARLFGLRVVVMHHGPDYERQKWGPVARRVLRLGERVGMRYANQRVVSTRAIRDHVMEKHGRTSIVLPNGITLPTPTETADALKEFSLERGRYVLLVSRLVKEKRHLDLIEAFAQADLEGWKLVLVGSSDHPDEYVRDLQRVVKATPNVVWTGLQTGRPLAELYSNAGLFVLPSSHEGMSIALLEALGYGLPVLASDIPANLEVGLPPEHYFPLGNVAALSEAMGDPAILQTSAAQREALRTWLAKQYDWLDIGRRLLDVYLSAAGISESWSRAEEQVE